jgi:basic membrane lipoprotein Med (substrate-binding protein (PBP1-ABC) superfamily)
VSARRPGAALVLALVLGLLAACTSAAEPSPGPATTTTARRTTTSTTADPPPPLKVAWINQGLVGSEAWSDAHDAASREVGAALGARVELRFLDGVQPDAAGRVIDGLAAEGFRLVFATSFPLQDAMVAAARRHPEVHFEQARGSVVTANLGTYGGADEEPIYLAGMAAAATSTTGVLGFVGTVPEAETIRHVDAFTLGAQAVDPHVRVRLAWVGNWFDVDGEGRLAKQLVAEGADVIATGAISPITGWVARDAGVGWVGHDKDWSKEYPATWITGAVPDWGPYYLREVRAELAGRWRAAAYYGDIADGFTDIAAFGDRVPAPVRATVEAARARIVAGSLDPFAGPLVDVDGRARVAAGSSLSADDRAHLDWLVRGIEVVGS